MTLGLIWRRLTILAGTIRTQLMVEIERNPLAVRQGAATIMCIAAAAVAMPVIAHRAAEQRDGAEWAATSQAFRAELEQHIRDEHSTFTWLLEPMIEAVGFTIDHAEYSDDAFFAKYVLTKR